VSDNITLPRAVVEQVREALKELDYASEPYVNEIARTTLAALVATTEKQKVVEYMNSRAFATGHGDTIEDLLKEMEWQVAEREREACAKIADSQINNTAILLVNPGKSAAAWDIANAIRARGSK
jgi:cell division protein ZapA (FtsZ GTPase activity inhibitor)